MFYKYAGIICMYILLKHKIRPQIPSNNIMMLWWQYQTDNYIYGSLLNHSINKNKILNISVKQKLKSWCVLLYMYIYFFNPGFPGFLWSQMIRQPLISFIPTTFVEDLTYTKAYIFLLLKIIWDQIQILAF